MIQFKTGDLFAAARSYRTAWTIVTTNGFVKANGRCVMGRGIAKQARDRYEDFDLVLGSMIQSSGNVPMYVSNGLATLPTKHNWWEASDPALIEQSTIKLATLTSSVDATLIVRFPKPGCGNGQLEWDDVKQWWLPLVDSLFERAEVWDWK